MGKKKWFLILVAFIGTLFLLNLSNVRQKQVQNNALKEEKETYPYIETLADIKPFENDYSLQEENYQTDLDLYVKRMSSLLIHYRNLFLEEDTVFYPSTASTENILRLTHYLLSGGNQVCYQDIFLKEKALAYFNRTIEKIDTSSTAFTYHRPRICFDEAFFNNITVAAIDISKKTATSIEVTITEGETPSTSFIFTYQKRKEGAYLSRVVHTF